MERKMSLYNENKKALIIGVAGGTASGKSTFCELLSKDLIDLKIKTIHMDEYFKAVKPKVTAPFTGIEYDDYNHPDAVDIDKLVCDLDKLVDNDRDIDVIIVEGLFALYADALCKYFDLKVFIDVQSDERLIRRIKRNMKRNMTFDEIASYYLDSVRYRHDEFVEPTRWYADIVLNGSSFSGAGLKIIEEWIVNHINSI